MRVPGRRAAAETKLTAAAVTESRPHRASVVELAAAGRALQAGAFRGPTVVLDKTRPPRRPRRLPPGPDPVDLPTAVPGSLYVDVDFDVPPAGKKLTSGRSRTWVVRTLTVFAPVLLVGGLLFLLGVGLGSARVPAAATISTEEASRYALTTFPVDRAAGFGAAYLQQCLTHPSPEDEVALALRQAALAGMVSAGVDDDCGWDGEGPPQTPAAVQYAGLFTVMPAATFTAGQAAYLTYTVTMAVGQQIGVTVPVWVAGPDPAAPMRVVGGVGFVPPPPRGSPPAPEIAGNPDSDLAARVQPQVIEPFLAAWAASDTVQLDLALTSDASLAARDGLAGAVSDPAVTDLTVYTDREADGGEVAYADGDQVAVTASVQWQTPAGGQQATDYQLTLRLVSGRWLVADVAGAGLDLSGGAAVPGPIPSLPTPSTSPPTAATP